MKILALLLVLAGAAGCASSGPAAAPVQRGAAGRTHKVVPLQFAAAAEIAGVLGKAWPGARVLADGRTNSVILVAENEADLQQLSACIAELDVPAPRTE